MYGDIIVQINQMIIKNSADVEKALKKKERKVLFVNRGGYHKPIVIK
jgi:hypothetical protein